MKTAKSRAYWSRVRKIVKEADVVLEVLDARDPLATRAVEVERLADEEGKVTIIVINKADLIPREVAEAWKRYFSRERPTIYISALNRLGTRMLWRTIRAYAPQLPVKVAVVGYPNVGKSTIINYLKGRHVAPTSPVPGWTRGEQIVKAAQWLKVIDTPGILPIPKTDADIVIKSLAPPEELDDPYTLARELVARVLHYLPNFFREKYGFEGNDPDTIIEEYARWRGFLLKGGRLNLEEAARAIIRDWQQGKIVYWYYPPEETKAQQ